MQYIDRVYGQMEIDDPLVLEIINTPIFKRLKGVDQAGYFEVYYPGSHHDRFEHSLGVYLLLKKYGAPREEQISGLIHDLSHAAFSHAVDYILDAGSQEAQHHQDNIFEDYVRNSELPEILARHGLDLDYLLDDSHFPLKENQLPDLCADRLDYSLRGALAFGVLPQEEVQYLLDNLKVENNIWHFANYESAKKYGELFLELNRTYYAGIASALMFRSVGDYFRHALKQGYIEEKDLWLEDQQLLDKVTPYQKNDDKLLRLFKRMNREVPYKEDASDYEAQVFCKSRIVDPYFKTENGLKRLSSTYEVWPEILELESKPKGYFIKFLD